jgi:uncharacterized membrane protein
VSRVIKKLLEWKEKNLISDTQYQGILAYEESLPQKNWGFLGFLVLGLSVLVLGIIAIVASHWDVISDGTKLGVAFLIYLTVAGAIVSSSKLVSPLAKEGLKVFYALYAFAVIGLIAQIYHLHGDFYKTGLFWSLITLLLVSEAQKTWLPQVWALIFTLSVSDALLHHPTLHALIPAGFSFSVLLWFFLSLVLSRLFRRSPLTFSFEVLAFFFAMIALLFGAYFFYPHKEAGETLNLLPNYILSLGILLTLAWDRDFRRIEKILLGFVVVVGNLLFTFGTTDYDDRMPLILGSIAAFLALALFFFGRNQVKLFNTMLLFVLAKAVEIYVRKFADLLQTGFGLVTSGIVILAVVYLWGKNHKRIEARLQELLK